jgi:hypothetical protein
MPNDAGPARTRSVARADLQCTTKRTEPPEIVDDDAGDAISSPLFSDDGEIARVASVAELNPKHESAAFVNRATQTRASFAAGTNRKPQTLVYCSQGYR